MRMSVKYKGLYGLTVTSFYSQYSRQTVTMLEPGGTRLLCSCCVTSNNLTYAWKLITLMRVELQLIIFANNLSINRLQISELFLRTSLFTLSIPPTLRYGFLLRSMTSLHLMYSGTASSKYEIKAD